MKRILYVQYTNPSGYPPLEHSSGILAENGWQIRFLGTRSRGSSNALKFRSHSMIDVQLMEYCAPGWKQKLHYASFWIWCLAICSSFRPHVVYASDAWSYPIGWTLSFLPGVSVIMHEHDTPSVSGSRVNRLIGWFRYRLAQRALLCICPQAERAAKMKSNLGTTQVRVVHNCPRRDERMEDFERSASTLRLWFHGSLVPTQLPEQVIDAMARCDFPIELLFCGYETIGHPGYANELLTRAEKLGIGANVKYLGSIPTRKEMFDAASKCDIGLTLFSKQFREPMVGASNKPFDYLACGLVLLVPDTDEWRTFFVDEGCALACDSEDVQSIASRLSWCWQNRASLAALNSRGRELLQQRWNYDTQFQPVLETLEQVASRGSSQPH